MKTVGLTACSDPLRPEQKASVERLVRYLERTGCTVLKSECLFASPDGKTRADALMHLLCNPAVTDIYDVSGGDLANEILDFLDWDAVRNSRAVFWGYSDLTVILNAVYAKTGKPGVLYSVKNLVSQEEAAQRRRFENPRALFSPTFHFLQGEQMEGVLTGGNIRCFLKLAGTPYFPDLRGKLLLLEAFHGQVPQMTAYLSQLRSCGAFADIGGILLGTFTEMEQKQLKPDMPSLVRSFAGEHIPIACTADIGHGADAKAVRIGAPLHLVRTADGTAVSC